MFMYERKNRTSTVLGFDNLVVAALVLLALTAIVGSGLACINISKWGDPRLFSFIGGEWADGRIPYKDVWDIKPPGIFFLMAVADTGSEGGWQKFIGIQAFFQALAFSLVFLLGRIAGFCKIAAAFGGMVTAFLSGAYAAGGFPELFTLAPATSAIVCCLLYISSRSWLWTLAAGLFVGIATQFKLPGAAAGLAIGALGIYLLAVRRIGFAELFRAFAGTILGFIMAWAPCVVYFAWKGSASDMLFASLIYPFLYSGKHSVDFSWFISKNVTEMQEMALPLALSLSAAVVAIKKVSQKLTERWRPVSIAENSNSLFNDLLVLAGFWFFFDFAGIFFSSRLYGHYYASAAASIGILTGCTLHLFLCNQKHIAGYLKGALVFSLASPIIASVALQTSNLAYDIHEGKEPMSAEPGFIIGKTLRRIGQPDDGLFVFDYYPIVYDISKLRNASRFTTTVNFSDVEIIGRQWFDELMEDLSRTPPVFVVLRDGHENYDILKKKMRKRFDEWVSVEFKELCRQGPWLLLVRNDVKNARFDIHSLPATCDSVPPSIPAD